LFTHRYRAVEPSKRRFFVDLLPQITAFDYPENENAQDYRRICEESGWNFITANKQFHVFCADGENDSPIPIHTDNGIHAKIYLKACKKYELPVFLFSLVLLWFISPMGRGAELLLSNILLFQAIGYFCFLPGYIWTLAFVIRWYVRTRRSAKNDLPMPLVNRHCANLRSIVFIAGFALLLICSILGIVLEIAGGMPLTVGLIVVLPLLALCVGLWIRKQIDTRRRTRAGNIGLTVAALIIMEIVIVGGTIFAIMNMPFTLDADSLGNRPALTISDAGDNSEPRRSRTNINGTAAVPVDYEHEEFGGEGAVSTHVYRTVNRTLTNWLYDHLAEQFSERYNEWMDISDDDQDSLAVLSAADADYWGAEKGMAFQFADSNAIELLILNDKTILRLSADGTNVSLESLRQAIKKLWD
jgi:hypothetical protein